MREYEGRGRERAHEFESNVLASPLSLSAKSSNEFNYSH